MAEFKDKQKLYGKKESYAGYAGSDDDQDNEARKVEYAKV